MKIYLFNPETGIYLGEDFADEAPMKRDVFVIPPDATTIAPPRVESGQVLVFNAGKQEWEIHHCQCKGSAKAAQSKCVESTL
jgi:hypothetical protein